MCVSVRSTTKRSRGDQPLACRVPLVDILVPNEHDVVRFSLQARIEVMCRAVDLTVCDVTGNVASMIAYEVERLGVAGDQAGDRGVTRRGRSGH